MTKEAALKQHFGYDSFLPMQSEIIDCIMSGKDCLVLMPTGGGKSICFQIPALLKQGITIVISPLIALMRDQVVALKANGIKAEFLNSTISDSEAASILKKCENEDIKILYISPEKLASVNFVYFLKSVDVQLFAIDEAHCISFWGHDFRPEYFKLKILKVEFPDVPIIALTATADRITRKDILTQLNIENALVFISSFNRPNLSLEVKPGRKRFEQILDFLAKHSGQSGIIYTLSRRGAEDISSRLRSYGYNAKHYHAGMDIKYRSETQDEFICDKIQIICATIAFGMGIDKSNVRWVIHYNMPRNLESFYQEIGRAGRDGMPADTLMFYSYSDYITYIGMMDGLSSERIKLQTAKLDRIKQYAEADICRRKILLSYFNEGFEKDCGNCDVCRNPRSKFNGIILAQKALSAIVRTNEKISLTTLVDILRGAKNQNVLKHNYDKIKTFGIGKDLKTNEWIDYIWQMVNSGIIDIAYDDGHTLKLNERSWKVLKNQLHLKLAKLQDESKMVEQESIISKSKGEVLSDKLFEKLRILRKQIADKQGVPAYIVFSDKTLSAIAKQKPYTLEIFSDISGVGQYKSEVYGEIFINEIISFIKSEAENGSTIKGSTVLITYDLYQQGYDVFQICETRNLKPETIASHLAEIFLRGYNIDFSKLLTKTEIEIISEAINKTNSINGSIKPAFEYLNGKIEYYKIRLVMALLIKKTSKN